MADHTDATGSDEDPTMSAYELVGLTVLCCVIAAILLGCAYHDGFARGRRYEAHMNKNMDHVYEDLQELIGRNQPTGPIDDRP